MEVAPDQHEGYRLHPKIPLRTGADRTEHCPPGQLELSEPEVAGTPEGVWKGVAIGSGTVPAGCGIEQAPTQAGVQSQVLQRQDACGVGAGARMSVEMGSGCGASRGETTSTLPPALGVPQPAKIASASSAMMMRAVRILACGLEPVVGSGHRDNAVHAAAARSAERGCGIIERAVV